jgi:tetratricopeptide (TPR) repeat protein
MPIPKKCKEFLTATERERLLDRDLDPIIRKRNDLIVRNKVLSWIKSSHEVLLALEKVSTKKLKEEIDDDYIYVLLEIIKELLDLKDFGRLHNIGKEKAMVVNPFKFHSNPHHSRGGKPHIASDEDFAKIFYLESALEDIISLIPKPHQCTVYEKFKRDRWEEIARMSANATTNGKKPSEVEIWNRKGEFFLFGLSLTETIGPDIEKSIECFDKSLELNPDYVRALENKKYALNHLERFDEAIECTKKLLAIADNAIKVNPSNASAWFLKGQCLLEDLKRHEEAMENIEKAAELNPYYKNYYFKMPKSHNRKSKREDLQAHGT